MRTSLADPVLHLALAGPALLVVVTAPLCWLVAPWCRWASGRLPPPSPAPARQARLSAGAAVAALALALSGAGAVAATGPTWLAEVVVTGPMALFSLGTLATGATVAYATLAWRHGWWNLAHRVHFSAVAAALATIVAVASYYRLVGWPWFSQL